MTACSEIHTKQTNVLCGEKVGLLGVKRVSLCSNHKAVKG